MKKQTNAAPLHRVISRSFILFLGIIVGFSSLLVRVIDLQVVRATVYRSLADANRYATRYSPRERGVLFDRYGGLLVSNIPKYYSVNSRGDKLGQEFLPGDMVLQAMATSSGSIAYQLDRRYLFPESTAHVVGYVGAPTAEELLANRVLTPSDVVGKAGLEKTLDERLRGIQGEVLYEVNALGEPQRILQEVAAQPGQSLKTTIDPYLSEIAYQALGEQRGVVIITDTTNGDILSLVSSPAFSASKMSEHEQDMTKEKSRRETVLQYFTHPQKLFFNRAVSGTYPPGSVFKIVTALAALEQGSVDAHTSVQDEGELTVGEYKYANWYFTQYGRTEGVISLEKALARSNDIYFYKAAEWVGPTALAEFSTLFGFGKATGIELAGEAVGTVPDPIWKEQTIGEQWYLGNTYHFGIGQGDVLVTPLQIAQLNQLIGNKGRVCNPHLVADGQLSHETATTVCSELGIAENHLELVLKGMLAACSPGGTAFPFFSFNESRRQPDLTAYEELEKGAVACKTGTAEFGIADGRGYRNTHGWFVANVTLPDVFNASTEEEIASMSAEAAVSDVAQNKSSWIELRHVWQKHAEDFPKKIGITVLVESDEAQPYKEGSRDAAPIAKAIVDWIQGEAFEPPKGRDVSTEGE